MIAIGCTTVGNVKKKGNLESVPRIPLSAVGRPPLRSNACSADVQSDSGAALWMRFAICSSTTACQTEAAGPGDVQDRGPPIIPPWGHQGLPRLRTPVK